MFILKPGATPVTGEVELTFVKTGKPSRLVGKETEEELLSKLQKACDEGKLLIGGSAVGQRSETIF